MNYFKGLSTEYKTKIKNNFLLPLPGADENFIIEFLREKIEKYREVDADKMSENLIYFLNAICPIANELGLLMAVHPDDPPFSVLACLGLSVRQLIVRIFFHMLTISPMDFVFALVHSEQERTIT